MKGIFDEKMSCGLESCSVMTHEKSGVEWNIDNYIYQSWFKMTLLSLWR